jgi:hypothetical protein
MYNDVSLVIELIPLHLHKLYWFQLICNAANLHVCLNVHFVSSRVINQVRHSSCSSDGMTVHLVKCMLEHVVWSILKFEICVSYCRIGVDLQGIITDIISINTQVI